MNYLLHNNLIEIQLRYDSEDSGRLQTADCSAGGTATIVCGRVDFTRGDTRLTVASNKKKFI